MFILQSRSIAVALALALSFGAFAQQMPAVTERIDVRITNVDVVVTDRAGNLVTGLTKDDFELLENKAPQPIVNFYESTAAALDAVANLAPGATPADGGAAPALRRVIFYIDNLTLSTVERNALLQEMKKFAGTLRPRDEAMVATFNRVLRIPLPFTTDHAKVVEAFDRIAGESAGGDTRRREAALMQQNIYASGARDQRVFLAKSYAQVALSDLQQSTKAVKTLMTNLAGLDGKKAMVVASEGFPIHPGLEMFEYIDKLGEQVSERDMTNRQREKPTVRDAGSSGANQGMPEPMTAPMPGMGKLGRSAILEAREFESHKIIESIGSTANANGVTLYTIHGGAIDGGLGSEVERKDSLARSVVFGGRSNAEQGLKSLADITGGIASVTASKHQSAFERIASDLDSYYSLGYRPTGATGERPILVRVKKGRYVVRSRRTHVQKSVEQEMSDRVIANLFSTPKENDLKVTITTAEPVVQLDGKVRVGTKIHVPMDSLTLLEQSHGGLEGGFDVFLVAVDASGAMSSVLHRAQKVAVGPTEKETAKGTSYTYSVDLLMNKEIVRVSAAIVDSTSNVSSFARYDR